MRGILLDNDMRLKVNVRLQGGLITGGLVIGDNTDQCAAIALQMMPGELKEDPILGAGLSKFIRGKYSKSEVEQKIRQHLTRAGINYNDYRQLILIMINNQDTI